MLIRDIANLRNDPMCQVGNSFYFEQFTHFKVYHRMEGLIAVSLRILIAIRVLIRGQLEFFH